MSAPDIPGRAPVLPRVLMWAGLLTVAGAAAVLSFAALRDLAALCGFGPALAPLLPVTVDAGAAVASLVWLGRWAPGPARRFARGLALALLGGSVAGNALGHGLVAYSARPHWLVVVAVSAVAPAVLGAVVHLATLATLATHTPATGVAGQASAPDHRPDQTGPAPDQTGPAPDQTGPDRQPDQTGPAAGPAPDHPDRDIPVAEDLLAELDVPGWVGAGWSGEVDQHPDQHPDRTGGPGSGPDRTAGARPGRRRRHVGR